MDVFSVKHYNQPHGYVINEFKSYPIMANSYSVVISKTDHFLDPFDLAY